MQYRGKYYAMRALQVVGALMGISGLAKMGNAFLDMSTSGQGMFLGGMLVSAGAAVGIGASVAAKYYETKMTTANSDKIALDALNQLGEQYAKERRQK